MRILFLAAEAEPFVKVGGLGDVAGSLPRALRSLGQPVSEVDVRLALPFSGAIRRQGYDLDPLATFTIPHTDGPIRAEVHATHMSGVPVYLIAGAPVSSETQVYSLDAAADGYKFTFFSLAALELARFLDWAPHVLHANDWHTAPAVYALNVQKNPFFQGTASLLGVHNLPYLGVGAGVALQNFGLPPASGSRLPVWAQNLPLPLGLLTAQAIVAPSPAYAREILTPEFGSGLEAFLRSRQASIFGILNGINTEKWDPSLDQDIAFQYSLDTLDGRQANRVALASELGLDPDPTVPIMVMITRLDPQKGVDLLPQALRSMDDSAWQAVILGTGQPDLEAEVLALQDEYPERIRAVVRYDAALSRRLYAGGDLLLMPSRYEPCGLNQMIAMRYGCVPLARSVGGLRDTILDYDSTQENSTGFLFEKATSEDLAACIQRALRVFTRRDAWRALQRCGMRQDFSWERSAQAYLQLYQQLITSRATL